MCEQGQTELVAVWDGTAVQDVAVDSCIADLVAILNGRGVRTVASCCGHGKQPGNIALADGREIIIVPDYESGRKVDALFLSSHKTIGDLLNYWDIKGEKMQTNEKDPAIQEEFGNKDPDKPTLIISTQAALRELSVAVQQYMNCPCAGHRLSVVTAQEEAGKYY